MNKKQISVQPILWRQYDLAIGIDVGVQTGFAVWNLHAKRLTVVDSVLIHQAFDRLKQYREKFRVAVRFEDARKRTWFPKNSGPEKWQGAGSVKRDSTIWEDFLTDEGFAFQAIAPANNTTKLDRATFNKYTGWAGNTNEHGRDAAMLVFSL